MFGHKSKKPAPQPRLSVWNAEGEALYDGLLTSLRLTEDMVKALSVQFFDDPEPCEIHRAAVLSRVFMELRETLVPGEAVELSGLDAGSRSYFSAYPGAARVALRIE